MLKLSSYNDQKITVIKAVRNLTAFGLKEAKELVESAPVEIPARSLKMDEAQALRLLREAGATVSLVHEVDYEVQVMGKICELLSEFEPTAKERIATWVYDRYARTL